MRIVCRTLLLFAALAITAAAHAEMVGHWTFDEGSGTTAYDSSGNGHDGTIAGGAVYTTGRIGTGALSFDGTGRVSVPYSAPLTLAGINYTIAFWIKQSYTGGQNQVVISMDEGNDWYGGYDIKTDREVEGGPPHCIAAFQNTGVPLGNTLWGPQIAEDTWTHVAVVFNSQIDKRMYINGELYSNMGDIGLVDDGNDVLCFGSAVYDGYGLHGALDDIRLYSHALTQDEVRGLVPEPSTLLLLASGMIGLLAYGWKRK